VAEEDEISCTIFMHHRNVVEAYGSHLPRPIMSFLLLNHSSFSPVCVLADEESMSDLTSSFDMRDEAVTAQRAGGHTFLFRGEAAEQKNVLKKISNPRRILYRRQI
jgi:hypothetical protein